MKRLSAFFFAALLAAFASQCFAAEAPSSAFGLTPAKQDSLLPSGAGELPLMPENTPGSDPSASNKKEKVSATDAAEDALRQRIQLREAKTKAKRDPALQALWAQGLAARTDYEQRAIWKDYYRQLYTLMGKIDKTLKKETLDSLFNEDISRYKQSRIAPTEPPAAVRTKRN
jgi:hypothetical protein